jgi:hypothetical protein
MSAGHRCERVSLRLHWAARLTGSLDGEGGPRVDGYAWQSLVHDVGRSTEPRAVQGPGPRKLFGHYGASGMGVELDVVLDDGGPDNLVVLVEAKAHADQCLSRDHAFVFTEKVRDHRFSPHWRWENTHLIVASAGRVPRSFCLWCFYEGIDVTDPDRFPLCVLVRLPAIFPSAFEQLPEPEEYERLVELLCDGADDPDVGPVLLRTRGRRKRLWDRRVLLEIANLQVRLSEGLMEALCQRFTDMDADAREAKLLLIVRKELAAAGVQLPGHLSDP